MIEKAYFEFSADTDNYLKTAIDLFGNYEWGIYDLLCLPPSFPYGGMENPCLTFITPTLLAGDRSLTAVVAHEIAHRFLLLSISEILLFPFSLAQVAFSPFLRPPLPSLLSSFLSFSLFSAYSLSFPIFLLQTYLFSLLFSLLLVCTVSINHPIYFAKIEN